MGCNSHGIDQLWSSCPGRIDAVGVGRIAIDEQRARMERMAHAAHLGLQREQYPAVIRVDDILEAVLMLIALLGQQAAQVAPLMRQQRTLT
jgi:hypothetical protein